MEAKEEKKENPILVPYDFTSISDAAIEHASRFSQLSGQPVIILNVVDQSTQSFLKLHNQVEQFLHVKLQEICDNAAKKFNIKISFIIRKGSLLSMRKITEELRASFMFMGIDQSHSLASNVFKLIGKSPAPVFVIQSDIALKKIETIAFPVDDFEETRQKTSCAMKIAELTGAVIKLFSINLNNKDNQFNQIVRVKQIEKIILENKLHFTTEYAKRDEKEFPDEVLEYAQLNKADVIILMKTPRTFFPNLIISPRDVKILMNTNNIPSVYVNPQDVGRYH